MITKQTLEKVLELLCGSCVEDFDKLVHVDDLHRVEQLVNKLAYMHKLSKLQRSLFTNQDTGVGEVEQLLH